MSSPLIPLTRAPLPLPEPMQVPPCPLKERWEASADARRDALRDDRDRTAQRESAASPTQRGKDPADAPPPAIALAALMSRVTAPRLARLGVAMAPWPAAGGGTDSRRPGMPKQHAAAVGGHGLMPAAGGGTDSRRPGVPEQHAAAVGGHGLVPAAGDGTDSRRPAMPEQYAAAAGRSPVTANATDAAIAGLPPSSRDLPPPPHAVATEAANVPATTGPSAAGLPIGKPDAEVGGPGAPVAMTTSVAQDASRRDLPVGATVVAGQLQPAPMPASRPALAAAPGQTPGARVVAAQVAANAATANQPAPPTLSVPMNRLGEGQLVVASWPQGMQGSHVQLRSSTVLGQRVLSDALATAGGSDAGPWIVDACGNADDHGRRRDQSQALPWEDD